MNTRSRPYLGLAFLTGLNLFNYLDRYVLNAVLPKIQDDLSLSSTLAGWLPSAFMVGYFLTAPLFGYWGDRSPRKWLIAFGIVVWSIGRSSAAIAIRTRRWLHAACWWVSAKPVTRPSRRRGCRTCFPRAAATTL